MLTFVGAYDQGTVANAIRREMLREGQTFFVHNRVDSIDRVAYEVRQAVPEARVAVAHGQMHEDQLERVMLDFWDKQYDVLVSTTIIESGIDIPNANTLIVDRADTLGLAQLYQLRGTGRALARPGLRLPVLPARAVDHRDRPPAAGHRGHPPGPGLGHGHRHEGPRDPRRRQPARGRPVGPRRPGRLRHVHAAAGRGRGRAPRPPHRAAQGAEAGGPGGRPPARRVRAKGAAAAGGLPPPRRGQGRSPRSRPSGPSWPTATARPRPPSGTCSSWPGSGPRRPPSASPRSSASGAGRA